MFLKHISRREPFALRTRRLTMKLCASRSLLLRNAANQVTCIFLVLWSEFEFRLVQFHTGLGDNDITLSLSSPAHLQPIIKAYPKTLFVLLHSSYPYTREAGYLTAVYHNVYLDFGEVCL